MLASTAAVSDVGRRWSLLCRCEVGQGLALPSSRWASPLLVALPRPSLCCVVRVCATFPEFRRGHVACGMWWCWWDLMLMMAHLLAGMWEP